MLELMLCSLFTLVPDYLYRRYGQGKRFGKEITLFSVWFELRWGITGCLMLTIRLITHDLLFSPVDDFSGAVLPDCSDRSRNGRACRRGQCRLQRARHQGHVLFTLDCSKQQAALETAERKIAEVDAQLVSAKVDVAKAEAQLQQANSDYKQAKDELDVKSDLQRRNPGIVPQRDIEKLQVLVDGRQAAIDAATAAKQSTEIQVSTLLPAAKASAEAALWRRPRSIWTRRLPCRSRRTCRAVLSSARRLCQPADAASRRVDPGRRRPARVAGRIRADRGAGLETGHVCGSRLRVVAMDDHPDGHHQRAGLYRGRPVSRRRATHRCERARKPGTILTFLEPIEKDGLADVTAGSSCIVNAYTSNHEVIASKDTGAFHGFVLHAIDAVGLVHAMLLRIQALLLPIKTLVLSGH